MANKIEERRNLNLRKYFLVLIITTLIFFTGFILSNKFQEKRILNIKEIEDKISIDTLSSEIQSELMTESSCKKLNEKTVLSNELKELAKKLEFMETNLKNPNDDFWDLKKKYTLLQIKDLLLMKKLSKKCKNLKPINILYFYSNKKDHCDKCKEQGYVLTKLLKDNPRLRVYAFDYDLELDALKTLIKINNIKEPLPALVIEGKVYNNFLNVKEIQKLLPKLKNIEVKYLKYQNDEDSKIKIECSEDKQCYIEKDIFSPCGLPIAINKENTKIEIEEFNKKAEKLNREEDSNCNILEEYQDEAFCDLKENICKVKTKNE